MDFDELDSLDEMPDNLDEYNDSFDSGENEQETLSDPSDIQFDESGFSLDEENSEEGNTPELDNSNMANTNAKKTAIIAVAVGFGIIILCLILANVSKSLKNKRVADNSNINTSQTTQNYNEYNKKVEMGNNGGTQSINYYTVNNWVEVNSEQELAFNGKNKGDFTIINITNYAKVLNDNGDKIIRSIAKGYISGLVGTFEVDVPYDKAKLLKTGTVLKVEYSYSMRDNNIIINEINFR